MSRKLNYDPYTLYYLNQAGSGVGNVYAGCVYQKGHGIGSFLSGLFRCVLPMIKSGGSTVGSELLKTGVNIISDISRNESPEAAIKKRGKETLNNLSRIAGEKMFGCGYIQQSSGKRSHSSTSNRSAKKKKSAKKSTNKNTKKKQAKPRSKREVIDIFS